MENKNHELSEETMKKLQRSEALSDPGEYDISDNTYDDAPMTRQYVNEEVIVKGAKLVDEEEGEGDIVFEDKTDVEKKYTKKDTATVKTSKPVQAKQTKAPTPSHFVKEEDREYIDRNVIHEQELFFEKKEKPKKKRNYSIVLYSVIIVLAIALSVCLFVLLSSDIFKEDPTPQADEFVTLVENTNTVILHENNIVLEFNYLSEKYVMDIIPKEEYIESVRTISNNLQNKIKEYTEQEYTKIQYASIMSLTLDYLKNSKKTIDDILALCDANDAEIKKHMLDNIDKMYDEREVLFQNLLAFVERSAANYDIECQVENNTIYLDIKK